MNISNHYILAKLVALVAVSILSLSTAAQPASRAGSDVDHPLLARFPDSNMLNIETNSDVNYRIVLGSLQRTRGQVVPEKSERLRGDVTKILYEVSQEFTGEDVYQFFREQMEANNYSELFTCIGRACGSSNYWANDIFGNRILYGPERNQYYLVMRVNSGDEFEAHIVLYIITRGNRRLYAYFEIVEQSGSHSLLPIMDADRLLASLTREGSVVLPAILFATDSQLADGTDLSFVVELLEADQSMRIYLVVHLTGAEPIDRLMQRSTLRASFLRQQLIDLGVDADRIDARGVGPLAPACASVNCSERIELVLQ